MFSSVNAESNREDLQLSALSIKLKDIPVKLTVTCKDVECALNGVVGRVSHNHVVRLTRGLSGQWTLYDDLAKGPKSAGDTSEVTPIALYYLMVPTAT